MTREETLPAPEEVLDPNMYLLHTTYDWTYLKVREFCPANCRIH